MSSEVVATTTYSCPSCHIQLDTPSDPWDGWLRCPACGRASLPPEPERLLQINRAAEVFGPQNGAPLEVGLLTDGTGLEILTPHTGRMTHTSTARLIFMTGFVLCLLLALIAFLDSRSLGLAIFGFLSIGFFLLLLRTPRTRLPVVHPTPARREPDSTIRDEA